ncbi:glutamyl-tRNA(Gln) amidotransferase subunit C, chloroplastic/mitochondrial [Malus sylvestris]|uniref:glutamyl-tRNA(Gln) amidotransferase subunit C, chloroplastic/mitochondrial n=1 Tax=Malus sylvestris TaxID=3752 RepID=UPI0021ACBB49|nr:glutamyl-tRNA(Gln) amidotransferase subunit C, chloroplastic/mitochondrial [Malus sylvestris]XP_050158202.1 glutamyl-tRNA(Gln) amidotransferase subunit C, chloroplastic/mitochondrial [Malus sylvestris]
MESRVLLLLKGLSCSSLPKKLLFPKVLPPRNINWVRTNCSTPKSSGLPLEPPDLPRLAETARITLTPHEVEEFAPKIGQVIDWFGQLEAVDLETVEPSIRADTEGDSFREDIPETFENREAMIAAVPNYEQQYIKVPKVLNKE